ncbi:ribosome maturation factor RimM [Mucilaginibacter paludis]|uniref:Ribosome maturation factor RimM n=1 Tax=Mucilaginibacter paludis DSM 18603 TaxID=714943 RepID=H1YG78_9SPHI|nr:ribosome maturation factor RimM [Mucilaginibacter paludis]EHQ27342.1 Ribosome maturation factor rimM [Mucilaginibacter paludis DSM 18603]
MKIEECFRIGTVTKTRGLKGELQAFIDFDVPEKLNFDALFIESAGRLIPYFVESFKMPQKNIAFIYLEDIDHIDKASPLAKKDIYLPNKLKPKKDESDFGLRDLMGFTAIDEDEGELGEIIEIQELPQQLIATVVYKDREVLFPLSEGIITGIDIVKEIVYVDLPEGLLDIYLD